jgi:hypothetical protein
MHKLQALYLMISRLCKSVLVRLQEERNIAY